MQSAPATEAEAQPQHKRVMVVDDNPDVANMLSLLLQLKNHEVLVCYSPEEALERFERAEPEIVMLDLGLPNMDGFELCRRLKETSAGKRAVFVAQTGWGESQHKARSHEAGFQFHLVKPVGSETLDRLFREILSHDGPES